MNTLTTQHLRGTVLACGAILLLAGAALAAEKVERSGAAPADGLVMIENIVGSLQVIGWDKKEIRVTGTLGDDVEELEFTTGEKSRIKVIYPERAKNLDDGADLVIHLPQGCELEIEVVAATVDVKGMRGEVEVHTVSGDVAVSGRCEDLDIESVSARVTVDGAAAETELGTVTGRISVKGGEADLRIETVTGDVEAVFDRLLGLRCNSVGGRVEITADLAARARIEAESVNGDIVLTVPGKVSAEFEVTTFNGDIDNDFGHKPERTSRYAPGRELEFSVGKGEAEVRINTLNGSVRIRKR